MKKRVKPSESVQSERSHDPRQLELYSEPLAGERESAGQDRANADSQCAEPEGARS